jgi:imidazolonepropionase-like amidohydrolase
MNWKVNMMKRVITVFLFLMLPTLLLAQPPASRTLVFTHVTVIDCTGAQPKPDQTVVVTGNHITAIGRSGRIKVPVEASVVDATGKFLIPGLWDMHVHWYGKDYLPLFIANGVTGVRQMWGFPFHLQWRQEIENGTLTGPRMVIASPIVDGPNPIWPGSISVATAEAGRQAVRDVKKAGYDFVKVYNLLPREAYFAISDEAKKQNIPFAGHVPYAITAAEASDAGQRTIEHLDGILVACSTHEAEMRKITRASPPEEQRAASKTILDTYSETKARALFARFKKNHTWQCPTLVVNRALAYLDDPTLTSDPRLKYMPPTIREMWIPKNDFRLKDKTAEDYAIYKKRFQRQTEIVGAMQRTGVELLAGTDVLNPYCFPGFSLHDELALLVKAGLTPMEALQTATRNPARFLSRDKEAGTVEKGKIADLVLLDANPLTDIRNTTKINAVVVDGRLYNQADLAAMLAEMESAAKADRPVFPEISSSK